MNQILIPAYPGRPYLDGDALDLGVPLAGWRADALSPTACATLVARIAGLGPTAAPVSTHAGPALRPDIRNNQRVMFDDPALAAQLYAALTDALPPAVCGRRRCGLNERFRGYRYLPGHRFAPHFDGAFVRDATEASLLTVLLYLDEGCGGGATRFLDFDVEVTPRRGGLLWFQHGLLHEGATVTAGAKHVLRTDVMYRAA